MSHVLLLAAQNIETRGSFTVTEASRAFWHDVMSMQIHPLSHITSQSYRSCVPASDSSISAERDGACYRLALRNLRHIADRFQQVESIAGRNLTMSEQIGRYASRAPTVTDRLLT